MRAPTRIESDMNVGLTKPKVLRRESPDHFQLRTYRCTSVPRASRPAWSDAAGQDESHHAEPPKNRSTMTAYQKLVRSPSATLRASSDPIIPISLPQYTLYE